MQIENGTTGASRPNLAVVSNTAIVAYEETKGGGGGGGPGGSGGSGDQGMGKFVRYHQFQYRTLPARSPGCVISDPNENGRRVRFVAQGTAGASGLLWAIFWRQGIGGQCATADIALRYGLTNFASSNLFPAVDADCITSDYQTASTLDNASPLNISSNSPIATAACPLRRAFVSPVATTSTT